MLWNFKYPEADNRQTLRRIGHSNCYRNGMLTHTIHETERRCADYTFSLGIVCTQAMSPAVCLGFLMYDVNDSEEEKNS